MPPLCIECCTFLVCPEKSTIVVGFVKVIVRLNLCGMQKKHNIACGH